MPGTVLSDLYVWDLIASLLCKVVLFLSPLYRDTLRHGKGRWCPVGDVPEPVDGVVLESEAWSVCPATTLMDTRQESSVKTRDHWPEPSLQRCHLRTCLCGTLRTASPSAPCEPALFTLRFQVSRGCLWLLWELSHHPPNGVRTPSLLTCGWIDASLPLWNKIPWGDLVCFTHLWVLVTMHAAAIRYV